MIVTRVEKHIIHKKNKYFKFLDYLCFVSKNLYNQANYVIRQEFCKEIKEGENRNYISYIYFQPHILSLSIELDTVHKNYCIYLHYH